jgi:signal transduction histidine kinase/PAS domain-containing protein/ActR/RegA family two-component response regulator
LQDLTKEDVHSSIVENVDWQGFGEPSRSLVVIPLRAGDTVTGYVLLGLNPRAKYDADHEQFIVDLSRQLRGIVKRAVTIQQTQERENYLMTELNDTARRMKRLTEIMPAGIYEQAADGLVRWANTQFFDILDVPLEQRNVATFNWKDFVNPEDIEMASEDMEKSLTTATELTGSLRLRRKYQPPRIVPDTLPPEEPFWIMYSAGPNLGSDGKLQSLMGCVTDISHLKWTEQLHIRNTEIARRERKRQEEFIDITSHEMRNPLSAITQCADSIIMSFQDAKATSDEQSLVELVKLNAEAAESILFCAAHQRRIIDDVLTLGKLDSRLLTIFPTVFQPPNLIDQALQMFKTEIEVNAIEVQKAVDEASALTDTLSVYGDISRLMQILVNLLTNAIKFTRVRQTRNVTIRYGSSHGIPSTDLFGPGFEWHSTGTVRPDLTHEPEYGQGRSIYLYYAVVDSGMGVPLGFYNKVFSKFEQADRRTHTKYGGSGLGLYISRELAEMQGGCIGISSEDGVGSTFAFYTKARCADVQSLENTDVASRPHSLTKAMQVPASHNIEGSSIPTSMPSPTPYKILLVEDNLLNQKVLAKQLKRAGCVVRVSNNGGEAIDTILQMHRQPTEYGTLPPTPEEGLLPYFDCILMDWEMPVCDGLRATKRIREIETKQSSEHNVIIGVTANARAEQIAIAVKAGMDTVMPKPFRVAELLAKISDFVMLDGSRS